MINRRYALLLIALGALLLASCVVSLGFGPARVPVDVVWRILLHKLFNFGAASHARLGHLEVAALLIDPKRLEEVTEDLM